MTFFAEPGNAAAGRAADNSATQRVEAALEQLRNGNMVLVADSANRENEGDLIMAAECVTPEKVAFMINHTSGIICVAVTRERANRLQLPLMVADGDDPHGTAFTVTVDARTSVTTGVSAHDRSATLRAVADPVIGPHDLRRPGHVFPLIAREGGVRERRGHTEAAVDLCRLAGLTPAGVLAEVTNADGTMAHGHDLACFATDHDLVLLSVDEIRQYLDGQACSVETARAFLPTEHGDFIVTTYRDHGREHVALVVGDVSQSRTGAEPVLVRVHSECLTGDVFGSARCDCGQQLRRSLSAIKRAGRGVLIYLRGHEGRGIGLSNKIRAYSLQDAGLDTIDANLELGLPVDARDYAAAVHILRRLGVQTVRLMTNNPQKCESISRGGIRIVERVGIAGPPTRHNVSYLKTKRDRLHHCLEDPSVESITGA